MQAKNHATSPLMLTLVVQIHYLGVLCIHENRAKFYGIKQENR